MTRATIGLSSDEKQRIIKRHINRTIVANGPRFVHTTHRFLGGARRECVR